MYRRTYYDRNPYRYNSSSSRRRTYDDPYRSYNEYLNRYRHSNFDSPLYYGPRRYSTYPWDRDYNWRRRREDREERREESREERRDETREETREEDNVVEINKRFHVEEVDLNIKENTKEHHTNKYMCTKRKVNPSLVIRRGQPFTMTIKCDRDYNVEQNEISFYFKTGKNPQPPKRTAVTVEMDENENSTGNPKEWFAKLISKKNKSIDIEITPPCNCIIGEWMFHITTESKLKEGGDTLILEYKHPEDIVIILNPWCKDDQVYMGTDDLLDEYILNESGAIFSGNYRQRSIKPWNFGQFKDGILDICLHLIRKGFNNTVDPGMADVVKLSRTISKLVNASDENGVLEGNWSGNYSGGTSPTKWVGSVAILEEYAANKGDPVKYGQCWVFSAITTTVCRAIGLPCRSVTNYASAHDTDGSTSIDRAFKKEGEEWVKIDMSDSNDSIWNFHVWNEAWMTRTVDLGKGYDGWQVIDATPQEVSEGQYRCGPAPVSAIKKGEIGSVQYDAPFIFAEVNADVVEWGILPNQNDWIIIDTDPNDVGKCISTKDPTGKPYGGEASSYYRLGEKYRLDITNNYKYPEGSMEERLAVQNADKAAKVGRDVFFTKKEDISIEIVEKDGVMIGHDFEVEVIVKNIKRKRALRTIKHLQIVVDSVKYTGDGRKNIAKQSYDDIRLDFSEEKKMTFKVKREDYWDKMYELFNMEITAFAHVKETENYYVKRDDYRLRRPDVNVKAPTTVKVGTPFEIELSFKNTLPIPLTDCSLLIEGNGVANVSRKEDNVSADSEWSSTVKLEAETDGDLQINVSFACDELKDIVGLVAVAAEF